MTDEGKKHCNACMRAAAGRPAARDPAHGAGVGHKWERCAGRTGKERKGAYMKCSC